MKEIQIQTSIYKMFNKNSKRLSVNYIDTKSGYGFGTRIVGAKYNDFESVLEINVNLTVEQAKTLIKELETIIRTKETDDLIFMGGK